jgi:hypothetical protein
MVDLAQNQPRTPSGISTFSGYNQFTPETISFHVRHLIPVSYTIITWVYCPSLTSMV